MAANALRLRRSLALTSSIFNHPKHFSSVLPSVAPTSSPSTIQQNPSTFDVNQSKPSNVSFQFISSRAFSSRSRYSNVDTAGEIGPDDVLFEGCDYKHWLITMDFPKDPRPSPEEMVETYVQTAAKVVGSVEEAKKRIYACSTTTYHGFQIEVEEEVSEQFQGLPGVVFILPDSYIDPVNKEYGGDKYINGTIIPRPPPVQYGRQSGRYADRNRDYNRPPRGGMEQNGNYQGDRRGPMPSYQPNYNQGDGSNVDPSRQLDNPQMDRRNFTPQQRAGGYNQGGGGSYRQGTEGQYGQGGGGGGGGYGGQYGQPGGGSYNQGAGGQYGHGGGGNFGQGGTGQFGQGGGGGGQFGQGGGGVGQYGQGGGGGGNYGQGGGGQYGQGGGGGYGQQGIGSGSSLSSSQYGENPRFSQADQRRDNPGQQGNYEAFEEAEAFKHQRTIKISNNE